ncbi:MAG: MurR/RpiR family transcriptional regulator [Clostridia bacterium]|nr:MurR/RpiR family transcriptional regulator [Clostridia bacterium]
MIGKVFDRIEALRRVATKTELRVIEKLKDIKREEIIYMSITELANKMKVAEATVLRFCRKLGYRGFQDFKLCLSQELGGNVVEGTESYSKSIAEDMQDAIMQTYAVFKVEECRQVARKICNAGKVCIFGVGNSAFAPAMMKNKLVRTGFSVESTSDSHVQTIITSNLGEKDVLILVSVSGATKDIIKLAEIGKKNGTTVVVLTNYDKSPLAKYADYIFITCRKEAAYEGGSLATVAAQSYIVETLCAEIFDCIGAETSERSLKASLAVSDKSI